VSHTDVSQMPCSKIMQRVDINKGLRALQIQMKVDGCARAGGVEKRRGGTGCCVMMLSRGDGGDNVMVMVVVVVALVMEVGS
jgi:hypothetical protein